MDENEYYANLAEYYEQEDNRRYGQGNERQSDGTSAERPGQGDSTAVIVAPIDIMRERHFCYVTITIKGNTNRFYLHEVWTEKNLTNVGSNAVQGQPSRLQGTANILQNVISASDNVSKIVDENGEPMVVYHQTNSTIYRNVETGVIWDDLNWREKQEWEERDDWEDYWV